MFVKNRFKDYKFIYMPPRKQSSPSTKQQLLGAVGTPQAFLLKFIQRNFERRQIDQQSFRSFNKFAMILGKELSKSTTFNDVEGFVMTVKTVLQNFEELNKNKSTFCLYIQLLQICLQIFEKAVSLELPKDICCELLDILWPLYQNSRKSETFVKMQEKFTKISMPKEFNEVQGMSKMNEFNALPPLPSVNKYESIVNNVFKQISDKNPMKNLMKSFLHIQGQNFLDSILKTLMKCVEEQDSARFKKILVIYMNTADSSLTQSNHLSILMSKLLSHSNKIDFIYEIFQTAELDKFDTPNNILVVSLATLDYIFSEKIMNQKALEIIKKFRKYLNVFEEINTVGDEQKLLGLYNKVLSLLLIGKTSKEGQHLPQTKLHKNKSNMKSDKMDQQLPVLKKIMNFAQNSPGKISKSQSIQLQNEIKKQLVKSKSSFKTHSLKSQQMLPICYEMGKIFSGFLKNNKIRPVIQKVYAGSEERTKELIKICSQNISTLHFECLQLILNIYIPLLSLVKNYETFETINSEDTALMKIIKLRILEHKIQNQKMDTEDILDRYYKVFHHRLINQEGTNFDFFALTVLHEHVNSTSTVLQFLIDSFLQKKEEVPKTKSQHFRCCIALIASVLNIHHNITINMSYNKFKYNIARLNKQFLVQDFLIVNQVKENKLFSSGPRIQVSKQKQQELELISKFINKVLGSGIKIGQLINFSNSQENSYYYMILIEFCTVCMRKIPKLGSECLEIKSIIKIRKNNKYSLPLTVGNEIVSTLKNINKNLEGLDCDTYAIVLHLLMKFQIVLTEPQPQVNVDNQNSIDTSKIDINAQRVQQICTLIVDFISWIGQNPQFKTLQLINKFMQIKTQLSFGQQLMNFSADFMEGKKNKLKEHIKHFNIIKFYSEAISNKEMLVCLLIKTAIKVLEKLSETNKEENVKQIKQHLKPLSLFYDSKSSIMSENERKTLQTYIKLKLLTKNELEGTQSKLSHEQNISITKSLEENHEYVARLIIGQENNEQLTGIQKLFKDKTKFIGFLLEKITKLQDKISNKKESNIEILNLLRTLIENHNQILQISKKQLASKLQSSQLIYNFVCNRTKICIQILKETTKNKQNSQSTSMNQSSRVRICEKEEENLLEESRKIFLILSKILSSIGSLSPEKEGNITKIIEEMRNMDDFSNIYISIYIIRQILNISPILKTILGQSSLQSLSQLIFSYLMEISEHYRGVIIQDSAQDKGENKTTISTFVNYFIETFYTQYYKELSPLNLTDKLVLTTSQEDAKQKSPERINSHLVCLTNQKKSSYKCLKCDFMREICLNCAILCHKNHPIIYVQPSLKSSKNCQCFQQNCKINPKRKEVKEKRRQRNKQQYGNTKWYQQPKAPINLDSGSRRIEEIIDSPVVIDDDDQQDYGYNYENRYMAEGRNLAPRTTYEPPPYRYSGYTGYTSNANPFPSISNLGIPANTTAYRIPPTMRALPNQSVPYVSNPNNTAMAYTYSTTNFFANDGFQDSQSYYGNRSILRNPIPDYGTNMTSVEFQNLLLAREQRQRQRENRYRNKDRDIAKEKQQIKALLKESKSKQLEDRFNEKLGQLGGDWEDEDEGYDRFDDEDYEGTLNKVAKIQQQHKIEEKNTNKSIYEQTVQQSYLLGVFMDIAIQLCQSKKEVSKENEPEINWHLKLINPLVWNPNIVSGAYRMCAAKTFHTKLGKSEGGIHPSPCVSRCPIAVTQKFLFILSGPRISIHLKQQLITFLIEKNQVPIGYPAMFELALHFQPHSVSVGYNNMVCVAGLHHIIIYQYDDSGKFINIDKQLRTSINNDNINKIKLTKFGLFVGISRQIRLLSFNYAVKTTFKMPEALIKEWCVIQTSNDSFAIYLTISEGYIYYAEGNANSTGEINFTKKINDGRTNRPVGSFILTKKIDQCGILMLSTFKDKSIGHSLGRLSGQSTLTDINYIKLNGQGIDPLFEKYCLMGLSDIALGWNSKAADELRKLFIVTIFKEQNNDVMSVHRGLLGIIQIKQDPTGNSKYSVQVLCGQQQKCEYFEIVWLEDKKHWFIVSLHEHGSLHVVVPEKISRTVLEKQLLALKDKKNKSNKNQQGHNKAKDTGVNNSNEEERPYEKLVNNIKEHISVKSIKDSIANKKLQTNQFLEYLENSQLLKFKEDYSISILMSNDQQKSKTYQIDLFNRKKIITGLYLSECSDVILPTRKVQKVLQVGLTPQESLYFYAFGSLKVEVRKLEENGFSRDLKKMRNGNLDVEAEEKIKFGVPSMSKNLLQISVYGESLDNSFKTRMGDLMKAIEKGIDNPFKLNEEEKLENCLKNINLLLSNSIESNNLTASQKQTEDFVEALKQNLLVHKPKGKLYPWMKKVIYKALRLQQILGQSGKKMHVFNDKYHPLRYATETTINYLYQILVRGEINDQDLILLVNELYGLVSNSSEEGVGAVNQQPEIHVLLYYIAKYPALLSKLHKKIKVLQTAKILHRAIPLYIFGYVTLNFLGYHLQWILPGLCETVGKCLMAQEGATLQPSILNRFVLYKYLKICQILKLQAWLKNINPVDAQECMKDGPSLLSKPSLGNNQQRGLGLGGLNALADFGAIYGAQDDLEDEEAMIKRAIELSQLQAKLMNQISQEDSISNQQPGKEQEKLMVQQQVVEYKNVPDFIKDLIIDCLLQIDYSTTNIEQNCQKAVVLYVVFKLALYDLNENSQSVRDTFEYLCQSIQNVIQKLCLSYHEMTNLNTPCILMLWLNLFGMIFKQCPKDSNASKFYEKVKEDIMQVFNKFKIENVKRVTNVPNLFARRIKGLKITTKTDFIYGFISVLQRPCEANFVLLTLGCYWLFPHGKEYYNKTKYIETVRENEKTGNIKKIYQTALTNLETWKQIGDPEWLQKWIQEKNEDWPEAIQLLSLYYE